jgi:hypothetical protein
MSDFQSKAVNPIRPLTFPPKGWARVQGTVISSSWHAAKLMDSDHETYFVIRFMYEVAGTIYENDFEWYEPMESGQLFLLHYDPADPKLNSLSSTKLKRTASFLIRLGFALAAIALWFYVREHFGVDLGV